jgi:RNA polymerase sigma-70 factor (ECF subfamily)
MAKSQVPDSVLVQMYISGNEDALATLINRYQSRIFGFIYSKVNDRDIADDYFQETFIRVINTLKSKKYYDEKGKFLSWVLRIANNLIVDDFRKNKNIKMLRDTEEFSIFSIIKDATPSVESNLISTQIGYDLRKIIEELPLDQQEVLKMRFFQEMTFKEISEATNVSMRKIIEKNQIYLTA